MDQSKIARLFRTKWAGKEILCAYVLQIDPFHAHLKAILFGRPTVQIRIQLAQKDKIDLVAEPVVASFRDAFIDAGKADGRNGVAGFLQQLAFDGLGEHFTRTLAATGQCVVVTKA